MASLFALCHGVPLLVTEEPSSVVTKTTGEARRPPAAPPAEGVEFPNTAFIPGDLTEQLGVDAFFSLWFVFLDDDVFTSGQI